MLTFTPISCAAPLSSDTASMACPGFVFINIVRIIIITRHVTIVTIVSPEIISLPPARFSAGTFTTDVKDFGFAPNKRSAMFCKK